MWSMSVYHEPETVNNGRSHRDITHWFVDSRFEAILDFNSILDEKEKNMLEITLTLAVSLVSIYSCG